MCDANVSAMKLWSEVQADLLRWIVYGIQTMGLPANASGPSVDSVVPSESIPAAGSVRLALRADEDLRTAIFTEVYIALHEGALKGTVPTDLDGGRAWLYVVTIRIARRFATRQAPFTAAAALTEEIWWDRSPANDPFEVASAREQLARVEARLGTLPPLHRELIRSIAEGETPDEFAMRHGMNPNTVRNKLFRLRKMLVETLSPKAEVPLDAA